MNSRKSLKLDPGELLVYQSRINARYFVRILLYYILIIMAWMLLNNIFSIHQNFYKFDTPIFIKILLAFGFFLFFYLIFGACFHSTVTVTDRRVIYESRHLAPRTWELALSDIDTSAFKEVGVSTGPIITDRDGQTFLLQYVSDPMEIFDEIAKILKIEGWYDGRHKVVNILKNYKILNTIFFVIFYISTVYFIVLYVGFESTYHLLTSIFLFGLGILISVICTPWLAMVTIIAFLMIFPRTLQREEAARILVIMYGFSLVMWGMSLKDKPWNPKGNWIFLKFYPS